MSQPDERSKQYRVRIEKDYTVFCSGHFITYDGHECEPLHGHNYRAAAALEGPLDENAYVFDFTRLKRALRTVVDRLDHRMLLPTKRIAWDTRSDRTALRSVSTTACWPTISANVCARQRR